jgi:uncharacterized membrane protein SpoIIM required for sporulation
MKRDQFIAAREPRWKALDRLVTSLESHRGQKGPDRISAAELPALYRGLCQDLALARRRLYGRELVQRLNELALRGREQLYRRPAHFGARAREFISRGFPQLVRDNARLFWLAMALFYGPFFAMLLCAWLAPQLLYRVLSPEQVQQIEEMYDPSNKHVGHGRDSGSDFAMFGFYIANNVGISFRTFASGVLGGVGSIFYLVFNGLFIGAVFAHLLRVGFHSTLLPFVVGHGAFELTAIVISGMAGLKLGFALLAPGRRTRAAALVAVGPDCAGLLYGLASMLLIAAFIEGFWSSSSAPPQLKYAVGAVTWLSVASYFLFAGRRRGP